jgi:hypothetical protein
LKINTKIKIYSSGFGADTPELNLDQNESKTKIKYINWNKTKQRFNQPINSHNQVFNIESEEET